MKTRSILNISFIYKKFIQFPRTAVHMYTQNCCCILYGQYSPFSFGSCHLTSLCSQQGINHLQLRKCWLNFPSSLEGGVTLPDAMLNGPMTMFFGGLSKRRGPAKFHHFLISVRHWCLTGCNFPPLPPVKPTELQITEMMVRISKRPLYSVLNVCNVWKWLTTGAFYKETGQWS